MPSFILRGSLLALCVITTTAHATTYRNDSGNTVLNIRESANGSPRGTTGFYHTRVNGRDIIGSIRINRAEGTPGGYTYSGTFSDFAAGPGPSLTCTGDIVIRRQNNFERGRRVAATVSWFERQGNGCFSLNKEVSLTLTEPLPTADRSGNYTAANSNTFRSETNGDVTWPAWRVISQDGELNCRKTPNGVVSYVFKAGEPILAETRGANAFTVVQGGSWMLTRKGCYVRASTSFVAPYSLPDFYQN